VIPVVSLLEKPRTLPTSISTPIFERAGAEFDGPVAAGQKS
jgi:hypothetical protein